MTTKTDHQVVHEISYGIISVRRLKNDWQFFLVKQKAGHWGFPKGHPEKNETAQQTAMRELQEETGLTVVRFHDYNPLSEQYIFHRNGMLVLKRVTYFVAEVEGKVTLQEKEIADAAWASYHEALTLITFTETRNICHALHKMLTMDV
jgi:8-oxo-dGTP pyrophosphatase MutT (NUDIX family)